MKHRFFIGILILISGSFAFSAETGLDQAKQIIEETVSEQVESMALEMGLSDYQFDIEFNQLNSQLNLEYCTEALSLDLPDSLVLGRSQMQVRCKSDKAWALNVPYNINLYTNVVVLNQPLARDTPINAHHLDYRKVNLAQQRNGYFLNKDLVVGKLSRRALSGATILNGHLIIPALLVHKGDQVVIMAQKGAMSVKMTGEALNDGREGKQIRVKNTRSNRIIRAKVVDVGLVVVNF